MTTNTSRYRYDNETADHGSTEQTVRAAIARSISHNEIVSIEWSAAAERMLLDECEGDADTERRREFWGVDVDGKDWRVHLSR